MTWARLVLALAFASVAATSAHAAGGRGGHGVSEGPTNRIQASFTLPSDLEPAAPVEGEGAVAGPRVVDIPPTTLPAFNEDAELQGYFFVDVRLILAEGVDAWKVREKAHIIRDALIRVGHRRAIGATDSPDDIDQELARAIFREGIAQVIPLDQVERIEITNVDVPGE